MTAPQRLNLVVPRSSDSSKPARKRPLSTQPVYGSYACEKLTIGAGVAIFHIASSRVVVCWHSGDGYWFLPKGRRDVLEETGAGAAREGFEESGYRNRLLPIPMKTRQPRPTRATASAFVMEPIWTQFMPLTATSQYLLHWYIAETLPPDLDISLSSADASQGSYQYPPKYPSDLTLPERVKLEPEGFEPVRHLNTGVNAEEALYQSFLLPIEEAMEHLRGSVQEDVVRGGWEAIVQRWSMESASLDRD